VTSAVREQVLLAGYTTLGLGGPAARFAEAESDDQILAAVRAADRDAEPLLVLGGGSNMVMADEGFPGTVVHVATRGVRITADEALGSGVASDGTAAAGGPASGGPSRDGAGCVTVAVAAGEDWDPLVERCVAEGLSGIECLSGIPGLAGATPIQNVGAYGQEVADTILTVRAYDRLTDAVAEIPAADSGFGYRTSAFKRAAAARPDGGTGRGGAARGGTGRGGAGRGAADPAAATGRFVVLGVTFRLRKDPLSAPVRYAELARALGVAEGDRVPLGDARSAVLALRRGKGMVLDPADPDSRSAGSFFTNPVLDDARFAEVTRRAAAGVPHFPAGDGQVKVPAAWLIEHAGFSKGYAAHGARISAKHTLALVNPGGASTADLIRLAREIRDGVHQAFGVDLTAEPVLVGTQL
jgi:UDP-N-acetylmuramate dehydrogenase